MKYSKPLVLVLLLFTILTSLTTCGGQPTPAPTDTAPPPTDTPVPPTATPEPTVQASTETSPEGTELNLDEVVALSELSSYRASMVMRISGTGAGEAVDGSLEFLLEYTSEPQMQHIRMSSQGIEEAESTGDVDMYQLADTTYVQFGDQWLSIPTTDEITGTLDMMDPQDLLEETCGWKQQADTEYEGIDAYHWTMSTEDARECRTEEMEEWTGEVTEATGDLYVAKEGNYVLHLEMVLAGTEFNASFGSDDQALDEGRMEVSFDTSDVNQPFTIEIPEEALASGALPEDIPVPEDAEELTNAFGMISYKTAQTPAVMNDYYKAQFPANGWTEVSAAEMSGMFSLQYSKEGRTADLTINADQDSGKTSVLIIIQEPES